MQRWSIVAVSRGESLAICAKAAFRAVALFEIDLTFFSGKPREARRIAAEIAASPPPPRRRNFGRARGKSRG